MGTRDDQKPKSPGATTLASPASPSGTSPLGTPAPPSQTLSHAPLTAPKAVGQQRPSLQCQRERL